MHYAPRTIAFITELFHPPLHPDPTPIQRVHNQLFQTPEPAYKSFAVTPTGAVLSNPVARPGEVSMAAFMADRFQFREELGSLTVDEFGRRVRALCEQVVPLVPVQVFTAQQVTVRTLINPRNFRDSRAYLKEGMFGFGNETDDFGREPQLYGIRMVFPPSEERPNAYSLRIESFNNDPRSVFIENQASFAPILLTGDFEAVERNVHDAYSFLVERALSFVGRFDQRQEA
ncbi:MAG TPA: hypothetical protein VMS76_14820 [Planctomycetota bacterium]|nr:hypothetical protein [Planctomycetota bacterium]